VGVYRWDTGQSLYVNLRDGSTYTPGGAGVQVGSAPLGTTNYSYPGDAMFVSPSGNNSNPGTLLSPKQTIAAAFSAISAGGTIVARAGLYHEQINFNKSVTLQAYPGEVVWMDGSTVYAGWTGTGPWTSALGPDWEPIDSDRYAHPDDPYANLPEQVWVDGVALKQIADGATPATGQFSVNRTSQTITIGTSPAGKEIRVSDLRYAGVFSAQCNVYGIGLRRYSPEEMEGISGLVYFGGTSQNSIIENCVFQDSGVHGLSTARKITLRNITVQDCMQSGIQATTANQLLVEKFVIRRVNRGLWNFQPITAGIKVTKSDQVIIRHGLVSDVPNAAGVWFDTFVPRHFVGNVHVDGATALADQMEVGLHPEGADGGKFSGTQYKGYFVSCSVKNTKNSVKILDSGWIEVWNCDISAYSSVGMYLQQDDRRNDGTKPGEGTIDESPWLTLNNSLINNKIGQGGLQVIAYQDPVNWTPAQLGWDAFELVQGNWFAPAPPGSMFQLGKADGTRNSYNSLATLESSPSTVGGPPGGKLGANYQGSTTPSNSMTAPLPSNLATLLGITAGTQKVGLLMPIPTATF